MPSPSEKRARWSEEQMEKALNMVNDGYSQHQAAKLTGIPRRTLRNHLQLGSNKKSIGRKPILTAVQEEDLVNRILSFAEKGLPLTPRSVRRCVYQYCEKHGIENSFNNRNKCAGKMRNTYLPSQEIYTYPGLVLSLFDFITGRKWYLAFMKRHPNLSKRKAQFMNPARAQKLNRFIINDYFQKLEDVYDEKNLWQTPHRIYNLDEKGCRLTIHHQQDVITKKGTKRVHLIANEHAENVTVVGCVSAAGQVIPPMILFKGKIQIRLM